MGWYTENVAAPLAALNAKLATGAPPPSTTWQTFFAGIGRLVEECKADDGPLAAVSGARSDDRGDAGGAGAANAADRDGQTAHTTHPFSAVAGPDYPCMNWPFHPHRSRSEGGEEAKYAAALAADHHAVTTHYHRLGGPQ